MNPLRKYKLAIISTVNRVTLIGFVERDPELKHLQFGQICSFVVRTTERWTDRRTNEPREVSQWNSVSVYAAPLVSSLMNDLKAGMLVYVEGRLQTTKRQDEYGNEKTFAEVSVRPFHGSVIPLGAQEELANLNTVNRVTLIGFADQDPEIRHLQFGQVCKFVVRTTDRWTDRVTNEPREVSQWNHVTAYVAPLVATLANELKAGMFVYVEGRLQTNKRQTEDGSESTFTEVSIKPFHGSAIPLGVYEDGQAASAPSPQNPPATRAASAPTGRQQNRGFSSRSAAGASKPVESSGASTPGPKGAENIAVAEIEDDEVPF
ncbi:MAG: single-stranded DNA-binding protein [Rhodobacteraceae bacterium]|nr:single-stranded DNA-binding protein [Paracoccaceae bacterium]